MSKLVPKYTIWEAISVAISTGTRALEEIRNLARIPGPRGPDGLGFDDLEVLYDGERGFTFRMAKGDQVKEFAFKVPMVLDRDVFKETNTYEKGDGVTFAGSFWIAQKDNPAGKPNDGSSKDWRLAVKRGRNGADGVMKQIGPVGPVSVPGAKST
jgi:hypothetical protein